MGTIVWFIFLFILISLIYWFFSQRVVPWATSHGDREQSVPLRDIFRWFSAGRLVFALLLVVFLLLPLLSVVVIKPGYRGVVFDVFRGVLPEPLGEGLHLVWPLVQQVTPYDIRTQTYTMVQRAQEGESDTLWAPTADGLKVGLDLTVRYKPDPARLPELHRNIGPDYAEKVVRPQIRNIARMVVSEYGILDVYSKRRAIIQQQIFDRLRGMFAKDGLICEEVLLRDVVFTPEFEKALENKMMAAQKVEQLEFEVQQAQKRAEARIKEAQGEAAAFETINRSIEKNPKLLEYMWIHKLANDVKLVVVPRDGAGGIIINPEPLLNAK
ncbi:MAG: prohibitin family protein [Nitrospinota bacterium]|nr:MAG: prohibitin family protein [Nitrospinota bacterium]